MLSGEAIVVHPPQLCDSICMGWLLAVCCHMSALAGNRTRVSRVAGENSTTEQPMLDVAVYGLMVTQNEDISVICPVSSPYALNLKAER